MCANFHLKQTTLTFLAQICPKRKLGFEIQETNVGIRISILEIPCVLIFRQNDQLWVFGPKFGQKWILGSEFQKSNSGFGISTSKIPWVPIFSQNGQLYVQYFGSNIVECVVESRVNAEMSWVEVNGAGWRWMELGGGGWSWVEVDGAGWRWVHGLVISIINRRQAEK